jgi:hypothetical protein
LPRPFEPDVLPEFVLLPPEALLVPAPPRDLLAEEPELADTLLRTPDALLVEELPPPEEALPPLAATLERVDFDAEAKPLLAVPPLDELLFEAELRPEEDLLALPLDDVLLDEEPPREEEDPPLVDAPLDEDLDAPPLADDPLDDEDLDAPPLEEVLLEDDLDAPPLEDVLLDDVLDAPLEDDLDAPPLDADFFEAVLLEDVPLDDDLDAPPLEAVLLDVVFLDAPPLDVDFEAPPLEDVLLDDDLDAPPLFEVVLRPAEDLFDAEELLLPLVEALPPLAATLERVRLLADANPLLAEDDFLEAPFEDDFFVAPFELLLEELPREEELRPLDELLEEDLLPELLLAAFFVAFAMLMGFVRVN